MRWAENLVWRRLTPVLFLLVTWSMAGLYTSASSQTKQEATSIQIPKDKVDRIRIKSASWFDALNVNPIQVRKEKKMKGKKHFVELLHGYLHLTQLADSAKEKKRYKDKAEQLFKVTEMPEYHDLNEINIERFREDNISYLNACYLMGLFGLDNSAYKERVKKIVPRIKSDMDHRGINQRMAFRYLLYKLGLSENYDVQGLVAVSVIRARKINLSLNEIYDITHEIFYLAELGQTKIKVLDESDWKYLRYAMPNLITHFIKAKNIDLLAELVVCMKYLGFEDMNEYRTGLDYIVSNQNENGSFGWYEKEREKFKQEKSRYDVDIGGYLHTTEVCLWALTEALNKQ